MLNDILRIHNETVFFAGNGFDVDCVLKPSPSHEGYKVTGYPNFVGLTFEEGGNGYFGDSFEVTINAAALLKYTKLIPVRGWLISLPLVQMNNEIVTFYIESVATDRTLGRHLLKCSASGENGTGKRVDRNTPGGI